MRYLYNYCIFYFNLFHSFVLIHSSKDKNIFDERVCKSLTEFKTRIKPQIRSLWPDAQRIIHFVVNGTDSGVTYQELAKFVDKFGSRLTGTQNLETSIDYMTELLKREHHLNVRTEDVTVPTWTRGREWALMVEPRIKPLNILGQGESVGTSQRVLTCDVVVVNSVKEVEKRCNQINGKFVVFNFSNETRSRRYSASNSAKCGATALLVRTITPLSIDTPHATRIIYNNSSAPQIPALSITAEDADLFQRIIDRGENVRVSLYMEAHTGQNRTSRNTISEIIGQNYPKQMVIVAGHIDSWDVGQGAMDDGGGLFIAWRALSIIQKLGLTPKRTIRSVIFTGEEFGFLGAKKYSELHRDELAQISIALESDGGTFTPLGLYISSTDPTAHCIVNEVLKLVEGLNSSQLRLNNKGLGTDIDKLLAEGVPIAYLDNEGMYEKYWYFYHSNGDTMSVENSYELDLCTAVWTVVVYAFASIDPMISDFKL